MNRPENYIKLAEMSKAPSVNTRMLKSKLDDVETASHDIHLHNDTVDTLFWDNLSVKIHDKKSGKDKYILQYIDGDVQAGMELEPTLGSTLIFGTHITDSILQVIWWPSWALRGPARARSSTSWPTARSWPRPRSRARS